MADTKTTGLTALVGSGIASGDQFVVADVSAAATKSITATELWNALATLKVQGAYTQTYSTADKTHAARTASTLTVTDGVGTNDKTIDAITDNASTIAAVQELAAAVNALIVDLADTAGVVNALVDDLQALGLVG